jgi:uncharacterized protein (TIGR03032 family)
VSSVAQHDPPNPTDAPPAGAAAQAPDPQEQAPRFEVTASRQFVPWLAERNVSLAFTTYQAGKIFFVGRQSDGRIGLFERTLSRCMGLCMHGESLYVSTLWQLWRFENVLEPGQVRDDHDRLYLPQVGYVTGDLDVHDIAVQADGRLLFVNTLFSCLAEPSERYSFVPRWKPPFVSRLAAEDRCHLNGLAMEDGAPRYVTAVSDSDLAAGWREHRRDGGVVVDVPANEVVLRGLSMPHSPRLHRGRLWLHDSGTGWFGFADLAAGRFERVAFCPGYLRGLSFVDEFAVVGLSRPRRDKTFSGLPLDDELARHKVEPRCGLYVINLDTGDVVHWIRFEGVVQELYDVVAITGARRPMAIGFVSDEIRRYITIAPQD